MAEQRKKSSRVSGIGAAAMRGAQVGDAKARPAADAKTVAAEKARQMTRGKKRA